MTETTGGASTIIPALRNIAVTLLTMCKTRLELLANEIEVGKLRVLELMLMGMAMAFCFGIAIILIIALLVVLFWEQRLILLSVCVLTFLMLGGFLLMRIRKISGETGRNFSASLAEFEEDLRQLSNDPP